MSSTPSVDGPLSTSMSAQSLHRTLSSMSLASDDMSHHQVGRLAGCVV